MQIKDKYDLVVIGAGPAGTPVAIEYAKLYPQKSIALVDVLGELGGECLFQGCIPSKIMQMSAQYIAELEQLKSYGILLESEHYTLLWERIKERKEVILQQRTDSAKEVAQSSGNIDIIKAYATFLDETTLQLNVEKGNRLNVSFSKALIATGSQARKLHYAGDGVDEIITNERFFHDMHLPKSMSIIGGGAIAIEFAQTLAKLGVKIDLFVRGNRILKNIDLEAADIILNALKKERNITLHLESDVEGIYRKEGVLELAFKDNRKKSCSVLSEKVFSAVGRQANIEHLDLENAGVAYTTKGIVADDSLMTTNKNIFANGDVVENFPKFAHTAQYSAHIIAQNLFLEHNFLHPDFTKNSWVLFSMPNFASAGLTQNDIEKSRDEYIVSRFDFSGEAKSQIEDEAFGYMQFIVNKKSLVIVGISILHAKANVLGGEAALIVGQKMTLKELIDTIHPHPTISESFVILAKTIMGGVMQNKLQSPVVQALLKIERFL